MKRVLLDNVDSTNSYADRLAAESHEDCLIIAKQQTNGRGQFERTWFAEPEKSITMSYLLWHEIDEQKVPTIIADTLNELYDIDAEVVLPNDIYARGKKICGLLIEKNFEANRFKYLVVGVGINANNEHFPDEIADKASSIKLLTNKEVDTAKLIDRLTEKMESLYA